MGWVTMSERDLQRIEVLTDVLAGRRTVAAAATILAVSERQMYRLLAKYKDGGGSALIHKSRSRTSNRSLNAGIRRYAVELVRTRYADFGPTLATEILLEKHDLAFVTLMPATVRTSVSATRPSSRTNDSAMRSLWSRRSRISGIQPR
jgi:transposase